MPLASNARFSIATNVCLTDASLIRYTIPSWLRVWKKRIDEVVVVVDERPPSGRISALHSAVNSKEQLYSAIGDLMRMDSRIRYVALREETASAIGEKWFSGIVPLRCQAGTPILGFLQAIEEAKGDIVLRTDSDMLFYDNGWLDEAEKMLEQEKFDIIEPPKYGMHLHQDYLQVSSRAFLVSPAIFFTKCLPLKVYHLGFLRKIHRLLSGRSSWLALEQIIEQEKARRRINHQVLDYHSGYSVHVYTRDYAKMERFDWIVSRIETGQLPLEQQIVEWNLVLQSAENKTLLAQ
jgi:hypothetical protein